MDEPSIGLHFQDIKMLLKFLHRLTDAGNTVIVIERNPYVIKTADWITDFGPEGGAKAGGSSPRGIAKRSRHRKTITQDNF